MLYQISTAMASFCKNMPVAAAMSMVKAAGFDSLDFPFSAYSSTPGSPMLSEDWRSFVREVGRTADALGLPITQAHATWEQMIPADLHYESPHEIYFRTIEACAMLGCKHLILHPLRQSDRVDSASMRQRIHDWNVRWFHELVPTAERFGVILNLENTFDSHHTQKPGDLPYPYTTAEDMLALLHDIGSNQIALCLDTGHANISAQDIPAMIYAFRGNLATLHLNDNYGRIGPIYEDLHLFPGYGRIDWPPIFKALQDTGFKGVYNMEPIAELKHVSNELRGIHLRAAADTLRVLIKER